LPCSHGRKEARSFDADCETRVGTDTNVAPTDIISAAGSFGPGLSRVPSPCDDGRGAGLDEQRAAIESAVHDAATGEEHGECERAEGDAVGRIRPVVGLRVVT
jgi:hypothetical protein